MSAPSPQTTADPQAAARSRFSNIRNRLLWTLRLIEVRLRFVVVLVIAFLVVGRWTTWRNYWDKWSRPLFGGTAYAAGVSSDTEFFCPMCPGVLSDWPAICPVCHMDLVTRKHGEPIVLPDGTLARMQLAPYRIQQAGIQTTELQPQKLDGIGECLALPESAVIDTGSMHVVYVESMPGMFDGIAVKVGPRIGDLLPIREGLKAGQRVATSGAFLIDAETRLNPSLAVGYFGAAGNRATGSAPQAVTRRRAKKSKLSPEDQTLVAAQKICPVTGAHLNSMGGALPVDLAGRRVFICCAGCESALRKDPDKHLKKLAP
jgi:hypothetical protein